VPLLCTQPGEPRAVEQPSSHGPGHQHSPDNTGPGCGPCVQCTPTPTVTIVKVNIITVLINVYINFRFNYIYAERKKFIMKYNVILNKLIICLNAEGIIYSALPLRGVSHTCPTSRDILSIFP
jgi:hypothetical protein